jgi:tripartite-type tricarboxylate transporter receptor subunit TctC
VRHSNLLSEEAHRSLGSSRLGSLAEMEPEPMRTWGLEQEGSSMKPEQSKRKSLPVFGAVAALIGMMVASPILAQPYPSRPIQLVVAYPQGGTGEIVGRPLAEKLTASLGQPVNLEYRAGASGAVGTRSVARAAPDGYTLLLGQTGELVINRYLVRDLGYDPDRDLRPVALVAQIPLALVVKADAPFGTVDDLLKAARASRRGLSFSSGGPGTTGQFSAELLRLRSATRLTHVPSDGAAAALRAVIDGQVDFYFAPLPLALPEVRAGKLKILAVSLPRRSLAVPTVPTMIESGFRGFNLSAWVSVLAPRDTPTDVVNRLNAAINQALAQPDLRERLIGDGADIDPMSAEQTRDFLRSEAMSYQGVITEEFCSRFGYGGCAGYNVYE